MSAKPLAPPNRELRLSYPYMHGTDVVAIQRRLPDVGTVDGVYGPKTAEAVRRWRWRAGYPLEAVVSAIGVRGQRFLRALEPLPAEYRTRAYARVGHAPPAPPHPAVATVTVHGTPMSSPLHVPWRWGGGVRDHTDRAMGNWQSDSAVDMMVAAGTPVFAPFDAKVVRSGPLASSGLTAGFRVGLDNERGLAAFLTHMDAALVEVGRLVSRGTLLGHVGHFGPGWPEHLHFALGSSYTHDSPSLGIDPEPYLRELLPARVRQARA